MPRIRASTNTDFIQIFTGNAFTRSLQSTINSLLRFAISAQRQAAGPTRRRRRRRPASAGRAGARRLIKNPLLTVSANFQAAYKQRDSRLQLENLTAIWIVILMHEDKNGLTELQRRVPSWTGQLRSTVYIERKGINVVMGFRDPKAFYVKYRKPIRGSRRVVDSVNKYTRSLYFRNLRDQAALFAFQEWAETHGFADEIPPGILEI